MAPVPVKNVNYPRAPSSRRSGLVGPHTTPAIVNYNPQIVPRPLQAENPLSKSVATRLEEEKGRPAQDSEYSNTDLRGVGVGRACLGRAAVKAVQMAGVPYDERGSISRSLTSRLLTCLIWNRSPSSSRVSGVL